MFDAKLPHLEKILDPELVLHKFNNAFGSKFFKKNMFPESCTIERIQHKKGKRCRVLYRLRMSNGNGINSDQWFYGKLVKPGQAANQFRLALASEYLANGEWPAVSHWEDWDFILWAFPNDPDMPGLRIAADPDYVRSVLNENIHKFGYDLDWRCENIIVDRVKYMPGKRCVLRMNAELSKGSSERRKLTFFSKTYPDRNSLMHYRILNEIHQQFDDIINIPRPILYLDEAKSFWQENWPGRPLIDMLQYANWDALFRHLGELVAQFHTKNVQGLSRKADFITVINDAHEDAKMMGWLLPELRLRMDRILETLIETQDSLQTHYIPTVPIHGALRLEQFIARNNDVALLDLTLCQQAILCLMPQNSLLHCNIWNSLTAFRARKLHALWNVLERVISN
ncbi:MAG: hypothetical protein ACE5I1_01110 [bacterium]